jgi:hypothetical protein
VSVVHVAGAQTNEAAAQALFDQGEALMKAEKYSEACPKLAESERLDPASGTLVYLGTCRFKEGKLASAWVAFRGAIDLAQRDKRGDREKYARQQVGEIEPKLAHMTITVPPSVASLPGLSIASDGVPVDRALWGTSIPVDRGSHPLTASATGMKSWTLSVDVAADGANVSVTVPDLEPAAASTPVTQPVTSQPSGGSWQKPAAIVSLGVGVVGIAVGSVLGLMANGKHGDASGQCTLGPAKTGCPQSAVDEEDSARTLGNVSTAMFVVGGVGLAGAVVFWLIAPSKPASTAAIRWSPTLDGLRGEW